MTLMKKVKSEWLNSWQKAGQRRSTPNASTSSTSTKNYLSSSEFDGPDHRCRSNQGSSCKSLIMIKEIKTLGLSLLVSTVSGSISSTRWKTSMVSWSISMVSKAFSCCGFSVPKTEGLAVRKMVINQSLSLKFGSLEKYKVLIKVIKLTEWITAVD